MVQVRRGVLSDDVDHPGTCAARIMYVGKTIGQTRPEMQQRGRRVVFHPIPPVGGTRGDAFKQAQDAAQARVFERREEVHLRRSRIGETYFHALPDQRVYETFGSIQLGDKPFRSDATG